MALPPISINSPLSPPSIPQNHLHHQNSFRKVWPLHKVVPENVFCNKKSYVKMQLPTKRRTTFCIFAHMQRLEITRLASWKQSSTRKPLIIRGARQVGKTWLMKEFARP